MFKAINFKRLFLLIVIFIVVGMITGFVSMADEEAGVSNGSAIVESLLFVAKWVFILIELPVILLNFAGVHSLIAYVAVIIFDCILYSLIIEVALGRYKRYKLRKELNKQ